MRMQYTVEEYISELRRQGEEASQLVAGLSLEALHWQPAQQTWSVAQCLEHMAIINTIYLGPLRDVIERNEDQIARGDAILAPAGRPSSFFIRQLEPPPRARIRTFRIALPPETREPGNVVLAHFTGAQHEVIHFAEQFGGMDLGRVRFRNPFVKGLRFTVSTGLLIIGAHNRRHLWQARQVRQTGGFPREGRGAHPGGA